MQTIIFIEDLATWRLERPQAAEIARMKNLCCQVVTDGFSTTVLINHRMHISASDLAAGWPLVEITNCANNPIPPSTGATHTTLTGLAAQIGVTVQSSTNRDLILAIATPIAGASFQVLITRNPNSPIPLP